MRKSWEPWPLPSWKNKTQEPFNGGQNQDSQPPRRATHPFSGSASESELSEEEDEDEEEEVEEEEEEELELLLPSAFLLAFSAPFKAPSRLGLASLGLDGWFLLAREGW